MNDSRLIQLYNKISKHSNYQVLASPLRKHVPVEKLETRSRFEQERLDYVLGKVPYQNCTLSDIGGNTGFFSFEFIVQGARSVTFIEGNKEHSVFVQEAAAVLGWQEKFIVDNRYLKLTDDLSTLDVDICLLLNVLHHVGDDYGDPSQSIESAKQNVLNSLSALAKRTKYLIFQLGFNWKGDILLPLFADGTKRELIEFVREGTKDSWVIRNIGIAESAGDKIIYNELDSKNIERRDSLGEFLNRPIFIMESKL